MKILVFLLLVTLLIAGFVALCCRSQAARRRWQGLLLGPWIGVLGLLVGFSIWFGAFESGVVQFWWRGRLRGELSLSTDPVLAAISLLLQSAPFILMSVASAYWFARSLRMGKAVDGRNSWLPEAALIPRHPGLMTIASLGILFLPGPMSVTVAALLLRDGGEAELANARSIAFWNAVLLLAGGLLVLGFMKSIDWVGAGAGWTLWFMTGIAICCGVLVWTWKSGRNQPRTKRREEERRHILTHQINLESRMRRRPRKPPG